MAAIRDVPKPPPPTKRFCKFASLGIPIEPPHVIDEVAAQPFPEPIKATPKMVDQWIEDEFTRFRANNSNPPKVNQHVLWKGLKKGRSGAVSTQLEYFNGTVRSVEKNDDGHVFYFVS